ncbi:MAG: CHAT domain-containing protein [Bacteroidota bacterium]
MHRFSYLGLLLFCILAPLLIQAQTETHSSHQDLWQKGNEFYQARDFAAALGAYEQGFALCQKDAGETADCLDFLTNMAAMHKFMRQASKGDSLLRHHAPLMQQAPLGKQKFAYYTKWLELNIAIEQLDTAYVLAQNIHALLPADSLFDAKIRAQQHLAQIYLLWGRYDQADSLYQEAISLCEQTNNEASLASSTTNRARLLERRGNLERAKEMYQQALMLNQKLGKHRGAVVNGNNLGVILRKQNRNQEALEKHQTILAQAQEIKYYYAIAYQHLNIGINASHLGQKELALASYQAAVKRFGEQGAQFEVADTYLYTADVYWREKDYTKAESLYKKAIAQLPAMVQSEYHSMAWLKLSRMYFDSGQPTKALNASQKSLQYSAPGFDDLEPLHHPTTDLVQMELDAIDALVFKGRILWAKEDSISKAAAYQAYQISLDLVQELLAQYQTSSSQSDLLEDYQSVVEGLLICQSYYHAQTADDKWLDLIWETLESNKATRLRAALRNAQIPIRAQLPLSLYEQQDQIRQQILYEKKRLFKANQQAEARKKLLSLQNRQDSLMRIIKDQYPAYYAMQYAPQAFGRDRLKQSLQTEQLVVNYFVGEKQIWVYGLTQQNDKFWRLDRSDFPQQYWPKWRELSQKIEQDAYAPQWYADFTQKAYETYQKLLAPATRMLNSDADWHITIIPDGFIAHIPFAILLSEAPQSSTINYRNLAYLLRRASIRYLGAASLSQQSYQPSSQASYLGFAPGPAGVFGEALAYSQEEVKHGQAIWGGETYIGALASEAKFKQSGVRAQIIHIAAHGTIHDSLPLRSALSLAPDQTEDGRLEIAELYNLSFDNQLAILSACESGQGSWRAGEGLISLANGFHFGGCPNVLMSRWAVRDASTLPILEDFLEIAYQGELPEEALRQAQLQYLSKADLAHPFFWAGWMISGPTQPLTQKRTGWEYYLIVLLVALGTFAFWRNAQLSSPAFAA